MLVKAMAEIEYHQSGDWQSRDVKNPSWKTIESAIRRLDKSRWPYIWLYLTDDTASEANFEVFGGHGDYWIACSVQGHHQRQYRGPSESEELIPVWTSDQGFDAPAENVLHDIEIVLHAVKHFCETGDFDPSIPWE